MTKVIISLLQWPSIVSLLLKALCWLGALFKQSKMQFIQGTAISGLLGKQ